MGAGVLPPRLGASPCAGLARFAEEAIGFILGRRERARCLLLGLFDGSVGGALSEHERPLERSSASLLSAARCSASSGPRLGAVGPLARLADLPDQLLDADRELLEELVDVPGVVAASLGLAELDLMEELGRDVHASRW